MKQLFILLLSTLFVLPLYGQRTVTVFSSQPGQVAPQQVFDSPDVGNFIKGVYQLTENDVKRLFFKMPGNNNENNYSGSADIIVRVDTTSIEGVSVGGRDSLFVSIYPLFYDYANNVWESSSEADKDSLVIGGSTGAGINWGTTVNDNEFLFRADADFPLCNAVQVNVYTGGGSPVDFNSYLRISKSDN